MSYWLARAALLPDSPIRIRIAGADGTAEKTPEENTDSPASDDTAEATAMDAIVQWSYARDWAADLPSKLTASALPAEDDPEAKLLAPHSQTRAPRMPDFGRADRPLTGTEKGIAVHTLLQFIDFGKTQSRAHVEQEIARLLEKGHISPRQAEAIDPEAILALFASETGQRILRSEQVWRELRFSMLSGAENWFSVPAGEEVLLQGVVDCCIREGGQLAVIDYKTDYVTPETIHVRAAEYAPQVRAYAAAVSRILSLPVKECVLYFLRLNQAVKVPILEK